MEGGSAAAAGKLQVMVVVGGGGCVSGAGVLAAARERNNQSEMKLEAGSEHLKPCLGARCSLLHAGQVPTDANREENRVHKKTELTLVPYLSCRSLRLQPK